ncbi:malonyl-CoA decarboxylase family protein [Paracoccus sp. Z330]|uniref:Malonyl-CoA decarboxylase family protein n=1 Tax=Paracoccus onchidii TaxID=3017813 RepID=A0ABT4ZGH4_9RHOB|nr:malonyl-CoA decarboxylase family protein [Paracoccus onchidii]MDB6178469.1 malonyl-CoA decarboxylase family protein [Paracoccus onchidii]
MIPENPRSFTCCWISSGADPEEIRSAYRQWDTRPDGPGAARLFQVVESKRQTLLRRLNLAPGATLSLVAMRADLLRLLPAHPDLAAVDQDFSHLLSSWFNRGFLQMRRIDWNTPAAILTAPKPTTPVASDTAAFYSINNSLPGLKEVSLGNFLIKQVAHDLSAEFPDRHRFVTLSPAPGFARWLSTEKSDRARQLDAALTGREWVTDSNIATRLAPEVEAFAARYFLTARHRNGTPYDPVARFHLGNGASAWRVNWPADTSDHALKAAHGLMINYLYELGAIEDQNEKFMRDGTVAHGQQLAQAMQHLNEEY